MGFQVSDLSQWEIQIYYWNDFFWTFPKLDKFDTFLHHFQVGFQPLSPNPTTIGLQYDNQGQLMDKFQDPYQYKIIYTS